MLPAQTTTYMNTWCVIKKRTLSKSIYSLLNNVHLYSSSILRTHLEYMPWKALIIIYQLIIYFLISKTRKESSFNLGSAETKLLYTLHWILLEAADECALAMGNEGKLDSSPFAYLFPVTAITVSLKIGTTQVINNDCCGIFYTYL